MVQFRPQLTDGYDTFVQKVLSGEGIIGVKTVSGELRILLVEDDWTQAQAIRDILNLNGCICDVTLDGQEAVHYFKRGSYDAIVADIRLPKLNGIGLLARVRDVDADFPVLLLTGFDDLSTAVEAVRLGAQDYLLKPFDPVGDLLVRVRRAVAGHRMILQNRQLQEQLKQSESRLNSIIASISDLVMVFDADWRVFHCNLDRGVGQYLGFEGTCVGRQVSEIVAPAMSADFAEAVARNSAGEIHRFTYSLARGEQGIARHFSASFSPIRIDGVYEGSVAVIRDISEMVRMEQQVMDVSDQEQKRLARDLHGTFGEDLVGARHMADLVARHLLKAEHPDARMAQRVAKYLSGSVEQVRRLCMGLAPVDVVADGLDGALRQLCATFQDMFSLPCAFAGGSAGPQDPDVATHLYFIAREAMNHAVRNHAGGSLQVLLDVRDEAGVLEVTHELPADAACHAEAGHAGIGLTVMQFRARMIGASLDVRLGPRGVAFECRFSDVVRHEGWSGKEAVWTRR